MNGFNAEGTSESALNIIKLSSCLSTFVDYHEMSQLELKIKVVVISAIRRALVYPFYRNYDLALKVFEDLIEMTLNHDDSSKRVFMILNTIKSKFEDGKFRVYNTAFLNDMLKWVDNNV